MKKFKFALRTFIAMTLVAIAFCIGGLVVSAAGDSIATATAISFNQTYSGSITETNSKDVYKFTLSSSGRVAIDIDAYLYKSDYYIYDADGKTVWEKRYVYWNGNIQLAQIDSSVDLIQGTYYFAVCRNDGTGNYNFKLSYTDAKESFSESTNNMNNSILESDKISLNKTYKGQIAANDDKDLYKFTLSSSGKIAIDIDAHLYKSDYYIYDADGKTVWEKRYVYWNGNTKLAQIDSSVDLIQGTYYFAVCRNDGTGNYSFKLSYTDAKESFSESKNHKNNSILESDKISLNKTYKGQIAANDDKDLYKFTLFKSTNVMLNISANIYKSNFYIYNSDGKTVWEKEYVYWNDSTKLSKIKEILYLSEGTYYLAVCHYDGTGNYNFDIECWHTGKEIEVTKKATLSTEGIAKYKCFACEQTYTKPIPKIKTVKLSATSYTYNGKVKTPNVVVKDSAGKTLKKNTDYTVTYAKGRKNVGTYKVTVKMKGKYSGTKMLSFKIKPISVSKCKIKLSTTIYTYNGKVKTPNVTVKNANGTKLTKGTHYTVTYAKGRKNAGTYKVTIKMKGNYSGTKTLTFKINPPKTTVSKLTAGKKSITVAIRKKTAQVTGYQIQYSTSKKFTNAKTKTITSYKTTKYTLKSLSAKKTYYVRVRTYKTVNGKKYYSGWSAIKYTKTK